jgi:glycosyltransferase involved in cell wall biosynthesis
VTNFLSIQELVAILNLYPQASIHLVDNAILTPYCHFISGCKEFTRGCALCPKTSNSGRSKVALDDKIMLSSLKQLMAKITFYAGLPLEEQQVRQSYWNLNGSTEILIEPVVYKPSFHRQSVVRTPGRLKVLIASAHPTTRKGFDLIPSLTSELERHGLDQFIELVVCTKLNAALRRLEPERLKVRLVESMPLIKFEELMSECDVFLSLSREDSGPFTINMALALGLKVFSFDVGIAPYFKNLGRDVSIVDIIDIGALVQRLKIELCD